MTVENHGVIDLVSHNPDGGFVRLVMVEHREWGRKGALLHDLQAKLNTYLTYATEGQLVADFPELAGRPVRIELHSCYPLGVREYDFLRIVEEQYLRPEGIDFSWQLIDPADLESLED